jgi:hypothetical protein
VDRVYFDESGTESQWLANLGKEVEFLTTILAQSDFQNLKDNTFNSETFAQMTSLTITDCQTVILFPASFNGLSRLETLKISNLVNFFYSTNITLEPLVDILVNLEISNIVSTWSPIRVLGSPHLLYTKLKRIIFTQNNFSTVNFDFSGVSATIEDINLEKSKISQLADNVFRNCVKLINLILNDNLLTSLSSTIFDDLVELKTLRLQNNLLTSLPDGLFSMFGNIPIRVHFSNNPWRCDKDILYLRKLIDNTSTNLTFLGDKNNLTCSEPSDLQGVRISELWCTLKRCKISCKDTDDNNLFEVLQIFNMVEN